MIPNNRLIEKIENIDYTHLLGYPSEVVAAEVMSMVKDVVSDHMDEVVEQLEREVEWVKVNCGGFYVRTGATLELLKAIEIVKGGNT